MPQPLLWTTLKQQGNQPSPRSGHTITTVGKVHVLFGGLDNTKVDGKLKPNNQVYTIRMLPKEACEWKLQATSGDVPLERAHHSACAIGQDKLFIFGGYYSSTLRFNDVYILKIGDWKWAQPPNQKSGGEPKNAESKIGAPAPRANCSANYHKGKVYIFGGHGGAGYQRTAFNDLYVFDTETSDWNLMEPGGCNPPLPRGGHSAAVLEEKDKIIIYGGWSNSSQYSDCFIYDINTNEWQDPELSHEIPRWYHCSIMVKAIPSWKYFIFGGSIGNFEEGGNRTTSKMSDECFVLDLNLQHMTWKTVSLESEFKPIARESSTMFFDQNESRLVIFGGWANKWCNDVQALNVSLITGPPYAIYEIAPALGPLTGRTKILIKGDGFKDTQSIAVRFDSGKPNPPEVQGVYVNDQELTCETPSFESIGAKEAEVTLSINKGDYTITKAYFRYYLNTKAALTIAYGPGLLKENKTGIPTIFCIQARNTQGQNRTSGSDVFIVKITKPYILKEGEVYEDEYEKPEQQEAAAEGEEEEDHGPQIVIKPRTEEIPFDIEDLHNGSYYVRYKLDEQINDVKIEVFYQNENQELEPIRGSPFRAGFKSDVSSKNNELLGPAVTDFIKNQLVEIEEFVQEKKENINTKNKNINEDIKTLLKVKENLMEIEQQQQQILLYVDIIEQCLMTMSENGVSRSSDQGKVKQIKNEWKELESMTQKIEKQIQAPMKTESDKTKENIEKFEEKLKEYSLGMKRKDFYKDDTDIDDARKQIEEVKLEVQEFEKSLKDFRYYAVMFNFPDKIQGVNKQVESIDQELISITQLWDHIQVCKDRFKEYLEKKFLSVDQAELEDDIKTLRKKLQDLKGVDRKCRAYMGIQKNIKDWQIFLPLLSELKEPAMEVEDNRHWKKVQELVKKEFAVDDHLELQLIWDLKLFEFKDGIEEITDQAKQEQKMEKNIQKIIQSWKEIEFELIKHKNTDIYTLKLSEENFEMLEEHQLQVNNMLLSKYISYFEKIVEKWKLDLGAIYDVVGLLIEVQRSWSFLENLFIHSEEVKKELPNESEQFVDIDRDTKQLMAQGGEIKNVLKFCTQDGVLTSLEKIFKQLKICEKALNDFLDGKRKAFPRFYFVSVADLLDILSNGNNPLKINRHMPKIFQAIDNLTLVENSPGERPSAEKMNATVGGEVVDFVKSLKLEGKVEVYLDDVINLMNDTLKDISQRSLKSHAQMDRLQWIRKDPSQITLLIDNIVYCQGVEDTFLKIQQSGALSAMKDLFDRSVVELQELIKLVQGELTKQERQKIMCLITIDTHGRDVIDRLHRENVRKNDEFQWQSQLKFYWEKDRDDAKIRIADASFDYYYEYLGNGPRLVVTPLTDRIYVTATQALHLMMGCAPAGPAGTGKTETTKDLANALAKACYVFNCSGEMNYETMGNIFKGLASSGCWGCFDEFNRLVPEVLSVCSVQFKSVTDAIKYKKQRFVIEGDEINLNPTCGVFITMNPGYLGRSELPEGLKALFRPITVVVPDLELICENMLMAEGFLHAKKLAKKFVTLYFLCRDLLSKSLHYDWGLRAIKSVLVVAGTFKRAELEVAEDSLLFRALRDFNLPKIIAADLEIFFGLLGDLFPGVDIPRKRDMTFEDIIKKTTLEQKLYPDPQFILKCVQLKELLEIRHCVFIMGPPGAGKSKTWQTLAKSVENSGIKQSHVDLNPKVVSTKDFYGYNLPSKEWKDGLMSKLMRNYAEMPDSNPKWIMLDGDLDANWIESMNSVMDDNRLLTLANNERIPLKAHMRLIFEIRDLRFASPATVSRAGILYISDDEGYQWKSYIKSWIAARFPTNTNSPEQNKTNEDMADQIQKLFDKYVQETLIYMRRNTKLTVPVSQISMVISCCKVLQKLLEVEIANVEFMFIFALIWSFGGCLTEKDGIEYRKEFSNWWKGFWKASVKFPPKGTVFDYFVEVLDNKSAKLEEWTKKVVTIDFNTQKGMNMNNITVPTRETVATSTFMKYYIQVHHPCLLIGNSGCGKTQLCKGTLTQIVSEQPDNFSYQPISFNYYTDSEYLQAMLEQELEKKGGRQFGPKGKAKLIYYIDDLNMPQLDPYDTQTAIALLRQHLDYSHWYDIQKLQLKEIINTQHLATMNPSAGSFFVNPRYQRHFWTCSVPFPDQESLNQIYNTFLGGHLKNFKPQINEWTSHIIKSALMLHSQIQITFRKTAINFHYEFNLRHISNVFAGILVTRSEEFKEPEKLIKLWIHESERTYADRLVSYDDINKYKAIMFELVKKNFAKFTFTKYFQKDNPESLMFCNFVNGLVENRFYDQCEKLQKLFDLVTEGLREYNDNNAYMGLVLFEDALKHVLKICRIISQPGGHALLVGVGGSGKQSLSKLAGSIMQYTNYSITISATYGMADLRTDLQVLYNKTGIKDEGYMFLFTEGQITNDRFLVYINDLLSSGEISELYTSEEKEVIYNGLRNKVKNEGRSDAFQSVWDYFIEKVKKNLHMVLCFSPGDDLRRRARQFPALVNCTVIDWFQPWPQDALFSVAQDFLKEQELGEENVHAKVVEFMPFSFNVVNDIQQKVFEMERRHIYTTPKSFLELINLYKNMLKKKTEELKNNKDRYETGLLRLEATQSEVAIIEQEVQVKQVEAEVKKVEADKFAETVGKEKSKVEVENTKAKAEQDKCEEIKKNVEEQKTSTQADLDAAQPLVEEAKAALGGLKKADFSQAKSFANPPPGVPDPFFACMYLLAGYYDPIEIDKNKKPKNVNWNSAKKLMANPEEFLNKLLGFKDVVDANQVVAANVAAVKTNYLSQPDFNKDIMIKKSTAAAGICDWVINIVKYWDVIQVVEPKRIALQQATEQLEDATIKLNDIMEKVNKLNAALAELEAQYNGAVAEKNAAMAEAARCERRLNLAQRLVSALGSEKDRWGIRVQEIQQDLEVIVGDVLMSSAFISYAGPFSKHFRNEIQKKFTKFIIDGKIPMTSNINPVKMLTDDATIAIWNQQSLPTDIVSIENGTILTNSDRYPLMIDPQLQGNQWIREKEKNNSLRCCRLGSNTILRDLEVSIENGFSVLVENMGERIDAIIMPIVARAFIKRGKNWIVNFAGKSLTLDSQFKLFLHTKLSNPHYPPEVQAEAACINFTVTEEGLGDQLLALVVKKERPDLSKKKLKLIQQQNDFKIKLASLEKDLLQQLASAQGDILENITLIENLEDSKRISKEVQEKVEIAQRTEIKINESSEAYRDVASRGALFYFLLTDLAKIHSFYKYSLESFIIVIERAIDKITVKKEEQPGEEKKEEQEVQEDVQKKPEDEKKEDGDKKEDGEKKEGEQEGDAGEKKEGQEEQESKDKVEGDGQEEGEGDGEQAADQKAKEEDDNDEIGDDPLSPKSLRKRVLDLIDSITETAFNFTRRGLFERDKLIVTAMLCFRILLRSKKLEQEEVDHLILGKIDQNAFGMPDVLKNFITDQIWGACKSLEEIQFFQNFCQSLEQDNLQWKKWYNEEKAETADLPKAYKEMSRFYRLLLLRAMRPDRLSSALKIFIQEEMGSLYVEQPPFNIFETYKETSPQTPIFFVLFPGVDPTPEVERVGETQGISIQNGKFINISMGQGQENKARDALFKAAKEGTWIMLQNLHLMQTWMVGLKGLEGFLEQVYTTAHPKFRCFLSSEPPPLPDMAIIPESILQSCLKVANEAPTDIKSNLRRAYAHFDQGTIDRSTKNLNEFKAILFGLCFFHAIVLGRKKFGSQGWSRNYNFNDGDLTICADVLHNYLEKYDQVPYEDLRYIYGEIMYGGHITDNWDRRTNETYLKTYIVPQLLSNLTLAPGFKSPDPSKFDYQAYYQFIDQKLPVESPQMFGFHPNAEIGYLTQQCDFIMGTILDVNMGGATGGGGKKDTGVMDKLLDLKARCPDYYNLFDIQSRIKTLTPFVVVCVQECERMNLLLQEIQTSLEDLRLGLTGALNVTEAMEKLEKSLAINKVPDRWEKNAYPSKKLLGIWFNDMIERTIQLRTWSTELTTPICLYISYLFNPMSYLTAVMQFTAREKGLPLDNMALQTNVTQMRNFEDVTAYPETGVYVYGLYLEGAAWEVGGTGQKGYLIDQKMKELHPKMPVVNVVSVTSEEKAALLGQYQCPVYYITSRGPTYIFTANLQMESEDSDPNKWILAGVCLLLADD